MHKDESIKLCKLQLKKIRGFIRMAKPCFRKDVKNVKGTGRIRYWSKYWGKRLDCDDWVKRLIGSIQLLRRFDGNFDWGKMEKQYLPATNQQMKVTRNIFKWSLLWHCKEVAVTAESALTFTKGGMHEKRNRQKDAGKNEWELWRW